MGSSRRRGSARASASAAAAAAARKQWKIGDLVLAKMKGFPAWPAMISEPEKWGFSSDRKKLLVYFYGTKQIAFCNHVDIEPFTEEKKKSLLIKRQGKGADFVRAVEEIIEVYDSQKSQKFVGAISKDGGNDGNTSSQENLDDLRIHCSEMTIEHSLNQSTILHQPESTSVIEYSINVNEDHNSGILPDDEKHNNNVVSNDLIKSISILDQLRQIPMSSLPATRKRARDVISPSSVTKIVSSHRRSRSSLTNNSGKSQKLAMQVDPKLNACCPILNILTDDSTKNEKERINGEHLTVCHAEAFPVPIKAHSEDIMNVKTNDTNIDDGNTKEVCRKIECSHNNTSISTFLEDDCRQNDKFMTSVNTRATKARRKPTKTLATSSQASEQVEKGGNVLVEGGSHSDFSNLQNGKMDKYSNADGDEHLPLVKRARVRMGKQPSEENLNESGGSELNFGRFVSSNGHYESTTFSSPTSNCPVQNGSPERTSPNIRDFLRSSTNVSYNNNTLTDLLPCKQNELHKLLDVEAALPPSKRLHRALEAMSANAAEAAFDNHQEETEAELKSTDCLGSSTENVINSFQKTLPSHSLKTTAFDSNSCGLSSSLTFTKLVACQLTSAGLKPDDSNSIKVVMESLQKHTDDSAIGRNCYQVAMTSEIISNLQSSSPDQNNSFQMDKGHTYIKSVSVSPKETSTSNSLMPTGLSRYNGTATAIPAKINVCTATESDNFVAGLSEHANVDSSGIYLNGMPSVSSSTNVNSFTSNINGDISMNTLSKFQLEQTTRVGEMQNVAQGVKQTLKVRSNLTKLAPIKDLIAAAQAKRFSSRSAASYDCGGDGKIAHDIGASSPLMNKEDSLGQASPSNPTFYRRPSSDKVICYSQDGSRTPLDGRKGGLSKNMSHSEVIVARRSFESLLCSLSRTKESIGRATRLAIDCAKFGIAGEVIDMLLQHLEKESNLHKRVDLFFLVDSIAQCSRCQKGGPGDVYPSLVQAVLPRLLSAAAPPGIAASENRRQCHKVLRLWLERKTLPEFTVRHHIRELEYGSEPLLSISYSRRPPRTERPLNDPVREMEGMLVDEYGSNASFQLPQFLNTRILEDDEGSTSDEKCFEAVTPNRNVEFDCDNKGLTPNSIEKHRLVLEDVDGELEMEDVAPPCGNGSSHAKGFEMTNSNNAFEQGVSSFAPPLPEERPPTPPPLPSSPPPDNTDFGTNYTPQKQILGQIGPGPCNLHCSSSLPETVFYSQSFAGRHPQQIPQLVSQPCMSSGTKVYHLQPPPPVVSNQFSYIQAPRPQAPLMNQPSFPDNFHHIHDNRGNFYGDGSQRKVPIHADVFDRAQFYSSTCAGPMGVASEKVEAPLQYHQHFGPSSPCQDWSYPPRTSSYPAPALGPLENPLSEASTAPSYWRAR